METKEAFTAPHLQLVYTNSASRSLKELKRKTAANVHALTMKY